MNHSEKLDQYAAAMVKAQTEMGCVPMNAKNDKYGKYADLQACVEYAKPFLVRNGLTVQQFAEPSEPNTIAVRTVVMHESGQYFSGVLVLPYGGKQRKNHKTGEMEVLEPGPQDAGGAYTYARRYGYCMAIGLVADKDDDGNAAQDWQSQPNDKNSNPLEGIL